MSVYQALEYAKEIECPICLEPWDDPVELKPCGHIYCRAHVAKFLRCPECQGKISDTGPPHRLLVNMASEVRVSCDICKWQGARAAAPSHDCRGELERLLARQRQEQQRRERQQLRQQQALHSMSNAAPSPSYSSVSTYASPQQAETSDGRGFGNDTPPPVPDRSWNNRQGGAGAAAAPSNTNSVSSDIELVENRGSSSPVIVAPQQLQSGDTCHILSHSSVLLKGRFHCRVGGLVELFFFDSRRTEGLRHRDLSEDSVMARVVGVEANAHRLVATLSGDSYPSIIPDNVASALIVVEDGSAGASNSNAAHNSPVEGFAERSSSSAAIAGANNGNNNRIGAAQWMNRVSATATSLAPPQQVDVGPAARTTVTPTTTTATASATPHLDRYKAPGPYLTQAQLIDFMFQHPDTTQLLQLEVPECSVINDYVITSILKKLPNLKLLNLDKTCVSDRTAKEIALCCPKLTSLHMYGTSLTDGGLTIIAVQCTGLRWLNVNATQISDSSVAEVARSCRNLEGLFLYKTMVSDTGLIEVAKYCASLVSLNVNMTRVSDLGVRAVAEGCRQLRTFGCLGNKPAVTNDSLSMFGPGCDVIQ